MNKICPECWEKRDEAVAIHNLDVDDYYICSVCGNSRTPYNPFVRIEGNKEYHNNLVGRILQLMGKQSDDADTIDYLYMTKIVQELVKRWKY